MISSCPSISASARCVARHLAAQCTLHFKPQHDSLCAHTPQTLSDHKALRKRVGALVQFPGLADMQVGVAMEYKVPSKSLHIVHSTECLHVMRLVEGHISTNRLRIHLESVHPLMEL